MNTILLMREQQYERLNDDLEYHDKLLRELPDREDVFNLEKRILHAMYIIVIKSIKDALEFLDKIDKVDEPMRIGWKIYNNEIKIDTLIEFTELLEKVITGSGGTYPKILHETEAWLEKLREVKAISDVAATYDNEK